MPQFEVVALAGLALAALAMLLVTQTKQWSSPWLWLVPAVAVVPIAGWTGLSVTEESLQGLVPAVIGSHWGVQLWLDRLVCATTAFFFLQNRARAAGMKSEVWVLVVIFCGSLGLLPMLARTLYLERQSAVLAGGSLR